MRRILCGSWLCVQIFFCICIGQARPPDSYCRLDRRLYMAGRNLQNWRTAWHDESLWIPRALRWCAIRAGPFLLLGVFTKIRGAFLERQCAWLELYRIDIFGQRLRWESVKLEHLKIYGKLFYVVSFPFMEDIRFLLNEFHWDREFSFVENSYLIFAM